MKWGKALSWCEAERARWAGVESEVPLTTCKPSLQVECSPGDSPMGTCRSCKPWGPAEGENKSEDLGFYNQKLQGCLESSSLQPGGELKGDKMAWISPRGARLSERVQGLPSWLSGRESTCQCSRHQFDPWSWRIPHAAEQLSPGTTTTELVL